MTKKPFDALNENKYYRKWFRDAFPYIAGAVLLSLLQIATLVVTGNPWGVSGPLANWGAWLYQALGGDVSSWFYFRSPEARSILAGGFLNHGESLRNAGVIMGALMATLLASGFRIKKIKALRQVAAAIIGGLMMGYGARIAFGCNIGAFYSGIASLSLSGWVFGIALFLGAMVGSKLLVRYFL